MSIHSTLYDKYCQGMAKCLVEPSLARQYYTDLSDDHRSNICGEAESRTALRIKGLMGLDSCIFLILGILSIVAFGYWSIGVLPITWIYYSVMKGDASMGSRTFRWPIGLCLFWWIIAFLVPIGGLYGKAYFILLPLMYLSSLFGYRQASKAVMALAFRNERAFEWLTDKSKGTAVVVVK